MEHPISLLVFPVKDIEQAKTFYSAFLGVQPYADSPYYVGYKVGEIEIGLDPHGQDVISYIDVASIADSIKVLEAAGASVHMEAKNVGGGLMVAQVKDADGNVLGLRQKGE